MSQPETTKSNVFIPVGGSYISIASRRTTWVDYNWEEGVSKLLYKSTSESEWIEKTGYARLIPDLPYVVHTVILDGLESDTEYDIRLGNNVIRAYATYKGNADSTIVMHWHTFHPLLEEYELPASSDNDYIVSTMPDSLLERPIKVAIGGDVVRFRDQAFNIMALMGDQSPDLFVVGGDIANADSNPDDWHQWEEFWDAYNAGTMQGNKLLPIICVVGNHDAIPNLWAEPFDFANQQKGEAWLVQSQFPEFPPSPLSYGVVDIGDEISIFSLDTRHILPTEQHWDAQDSWMETVVGERSNRKHLIPVYHRSTFPAIRSLHTAVDVNVRRKWLPLFFNTGNCHAAFEHHEHVWKVTKDIKPLTGEVISDNIIHSEGHGLVTGAECAREGGFTGGTLWIADGMYFVHVIDADNFTIHENESDAMSGDNRVEIGGEGQFYATTSKQGGMKVFGSGPMADGIRDVRNLATTWYLEGAVGRDIVEGITGPHADDGSPAHDETVDEAFHFYIATMSETDLKVDAFGTEKGNFYSFQKDI